MDWFDRIWEVSPLLAGVALLAVAVFWWHARALREGGPALERRLTWLRTARPFDRYRLALGSALDTLARIIGDARDPDDPRPGKVFSVSAYWLCAGMAVAYPLLFLVIAWALVDAPGRIGSVVVLPDDVPDWQRWMALAALGGTTVLMFFYISTRRMIWGVIAFAFAVAFAGAFAGAGAVAFAVAFAGAFAGAGVVAVAGAVAGLWLDRRTAWPSWPWALLLGLALITPGLWLALADGTSAAIALTDATAAPLVLFLMLLPAANALLDWVSLGITRVLLGRIARGEEGPLGALLWALADTLIAVALLAAVTLTTVAAAALFDRLHELGGGAGFYDLSAKLAEIAADPRAPQWWWIYAMLLSTLIPTAIHFAIALGSLVVSGLLPRRWIADQIETLREDADFRLWPTLLLTIETLLPAAIVAGGFWWLVTVVPTGLPWIGEWLLAASQAIAAAIAAWNGQPLV